MDLQSDLVIKVKYGDVVKRFALDNLDPDIAKLREKIILAFNLSPSADFILTYADLDGDTVSINDDNGLRQAAINQKLNPLGINVKLKSQSNVAPAAEPKPKPTKSTYSTLLDGFNQISSSLQGAVESLQGAVESLPEPLKNTISEVTQDIVFPLVLKKLRGALFSKEAVPQGAWSANTPSGNSSSSVSVMNKNAHKASTKATGASTAAEKDKKPKVVPNPIKKAKSELPNTSSQKAAGENNNADKKVTSAMRCKGKAVMPNASQKAPQPAPQLTSPHHQPFPFPISQISHSVGNAVSSCANSNSNVNAFSTDIPPYTSRFLPGRHPCRKSDGFDSMSQAYHKGIRCDSCEMSPIVGPRYKSIVKYNYDLCAECFSSFGKEAEYTKIDRPRMTTDINDAILLVDMLIFNTQK